MTRGEFEAEWDRCAPWLEEALEHNGGTHRIEDVLHQVLTDPDTLFWPGERSAAVTQIIRYPRLNQHHMWLCGGDLHEIIDDMLPIAEAHGVLNGCTRFSTAGRPGWKRVLKDKGYTLAFESCWKELSHGGH